MNGQFNRQSENISTTLLRGGPSIIIPGNQNFSLYLSTDQSKKLSVYLGVYQGSADVKSNRTQDYFGGVYIRPSNSISVTLEPDWFIQKNELQYVSATGTSENPVYLFGKLDQKTLGITFRVNYTVNPELSIEYYGQPFIAGGKYSDYKKITQPDADAFRERFHTFTPSEISFDAANNQYIIDENGNGSSDLTIANPDFKFRQFRSNLVVRWEYSPGSTLYLVWSQGRTGSASDGSFSYTNDMKDLFKITPNNVFLIKFSYWFAL